MNGFNISIHGSGLHHDADIEAKAKKAFDAFVETLRVSGCVISHAVFTEGTITRAHANVSKAQSEGKTF